MGGKRILAVDDDPSIREMVRDYLVDNDFQVYTAASGEEMNQLLEAHGADLVILDVKLPGEDGFGIARALRSKSHLPNNPLVFDADATSSYHRLGVNFLFGDGSVRPIRNTIDGALYEALLTRANNDLANGDY